MAQSTPSRSGAGSWAFIARALRYRNYRLFFSGQLVSLIGTWMTNVATSWLVYRLTGSALKLGVVGFAGQIPAFLLAAVAGMFVDRWNKHRLIILTQTLSMLQSFALAALTLSGHITFEWLIWLNVFQGLINSFDMPARQAFLVQMIESKEDLGNAIALNSSMVNGARLIGPAIGGILIAAAGEGWCFFFDGVSFLAVLAALLAMRIAAEPRKPRSAGIWHELREGAVYSFQPGPIRSIIVLLALVCLVGFPYTILMPVFAAKTLNGGPNTLGFLMTASGCGALVGALWLASRKSVLGLTRVIPASAAAFGLGLVGLSFAKSMAPAMILIGFAGAGFMIQMASSNTILQTIVDDDKRGRVMSYFMMAFLGTAPFGSLLAGSLADRYSVQTALLIFGICCFLGAIWFSSGLSELREAIRPIYRRLGILPEVVRAEQAVDSLTVPPEGH